MTIGEAAIRALVAHLDLGGEVAAGQDDRAGDLHAALIEDARALTGLLAAELHGGPADPAAPFDAALTADAAHRATTRSASFTFHTALAMLLLRERLESG